ncbi:MAG: DNA polymerase III subunit delta [Spirochaetaceae bacterium]|jgi:DNA polymerase-3 subunit delta|nr:DNA polymerase III subunit delta [Spirochaetaceae bacterium]
MNSSFLFLGPELGKKLAAIKTLRSRLPPETEETSFYAGETPLPFMVSVFRNGALFSEARLFFIKNAEAIKKKDDVDMLAAYLKKPQEHTTVVLISDETRLDKRIEEAVPRENKTVFWELFENKKTEWVASFFQAQGCRIDEEGVRVLLEMVENNTDALGRECLRLILFLGKDKPIGAAEVENCLSHTREESAFTLFAAMARKKPESALGILKNLLEARESPQAIMASLAWCFRRLRDYLALAAGGTVNDFELKKIGLFSGKVRSDYLEAAKRWPRAEGALALIGEYEFLLRSSGGGWEKILMELLVLKLTNGGPQAPAARL